MIFPDNRQDVFFSVNGLDYFRIVNIFFSKTSKQIDDAENYRLVDLLQLVLGTVVTVKSFPALHHNVEITFSPLGSLILFCSFEDI